MNDLLSAEYLFQGKFGRVEDIYTYAFIYYNLSAVPKGGGGLWSFPYMPIILAVPLVVHRHIYALHHPPHHHIQREERQPHRHVIHTPLRQTPIFHGKKHYYCITLLLLLSATRCISVLWTLCIWTQKGHKPFVSILGGHLGHMLDTSWTRLAALAIG